MPFVHNNNSNRGVTIIRSHQHNKELHLNPGINKISDEDMKIFADKIKAIASLHIVQKLEDEVPAEEPLQLGNENEEAKNSALQKLLEEEADQKAKEEADLLAAIEAEEAAKKVAASIEAEEAAKKVAVEAAPEVKEELEEKKSRKSK